MAVELPVPSQGARSRPLKPSAESARPSALVAGRTHIMHERAIRAAGSVACGSTDCDAESLEKVWPGCRIDTSAFVETVSGSRPGCP